MMFFWFLFLIPLVIFLVARPNATIGGGCCGTHSMQSGPPSTPGSDPVEIVRQRLARGEITAAEYDAIRRALQG